MSFSDSCEQEDDSDAMLWHTTRDTPDEYVATPAELACQRSTMHTRSLILGLGHTSITTTARYLDHIAPRAVIEAMRGRAWMGAA